MKQNSASRGVASTILILVVGFFAFLSAVFWWTQLEGQSEVIRYGMVCGSVAFSFAGAACAYLAPGRSKGLYLAAVILMGADCAQNAMGYQSLGQLANGITEKQAAYTTAQAALVALPTPDAAGAIRQMSTYEATRDALKENVALAKADLDTAKAGKFPLNYVLGIFALLQLALLLAFRGIGKAPRTEPVTALQQAPVAQGKNVHVFRPKQMDAKDQEIWKKVQARSRA